MVQMAQQPPDFTLPALDGLTYSLHEADADGPVLLIFWQAGCGACRISAPYWNRLYDAYENIGWTFWTLAQDGAARAREFVEQYGLRPPVLVDGPALTVSDAYDPESTPGIVLIEPGEGVTLVSDGFEKDVLNDISRRIASYTGAEYVDIAPESDGNPRFKAG